jgi:DNA-binding XRE family transcriptional regulator
MLRREQVELVKRLLAAEISQREISRRTGISRDTIRRIEKGQWHEPPQVPNALSQLLGAKRKMGRCPECGALVLLPCLACHVRQHGSHGSLQRPYERAS